MEYFSEYLTSEYTWITVALIIFGFAFAKWVYPPIVSGLDSRANNIRSEIEEALRLKEEAQSYYAEAQRKLQDADRAASEIIERARFESKQIADEAEKEIEAEAERKMKLAEEKISRAETNAIESVRARAVEAAISAAKQEMAKQLAAGTKAKTLVEKSIDVISKKIA